MYWRFDNQRSPACLSRQPLNWTRNNEKSWNSAAEGKQNKEIAEQLGISIRKAARWRARFFGSVKGAKVEESRERPYAVTPHVRIRAGGVGRPASRPRPDKQWVPAPDRCVVGRIADSGSPSPRAARIRLDLGVELLVRREPERNLETPGSGRRPDCTAKPCATRPPTFPLYPLRSRDPPSCNPRSEACAPRTLCGRAR